MTTESRVQLTRSEKKEKQAIVQPATTVATQGKREIYYAPESAFQTVEPFIKDFKSLWDPASGPSENYPLKDYFESKGHRVICSDILMGKELDFFTHKTKKRYDMIVTTPPYSMRKEFIMRALELRKPFALLVPLNVLESKTIRDSFQQNGVSVIFPEKVVNFISPEDSRSVKSLPYSVWVIAGIPKLPPVVYL